MNYRKFVKMWCGKVPVGVIARDFNKSKPWVYSTVHALRKKGVKLPARRVNQPSLDFIDPVELNDLIESLR